MQSYKIKVLSFFKISLKVFLYVFILCGTNATSILFSLKYWQTLNLLIFNCNTDYFNKC